MNSVLERFTQRQRLFAAGLGIAQASLWRAGSDLTAGRLVRVLPDFEVTPESNIWAVRPPTWVTLCVRPGLLC